MAPLTIVGGALATVTLSACYGAPCVATVKLPDGGTKRDDDSLSCESYDCTSGPDGGAPVMDSQWQSKCK